MKIKLTFRLSLTFDTILTPFDTNTTIRHCLQNTQTHLCSEQIWQTSKMISNISSLDSVTLDGTRWVVAEPLRVSFYPLLPSRLPLPPPPLAELYKEQKSGWGGGLIRRSWNREANPGKRSILYTGLSPPSSLKRRGKCHIFKSDIFKIEDYE